MTADAGRLTRYERRLDDVSGIGCWEFDRLRSRRNRYTGSELNLISLYLRVYSAFLIA
ncbi:hypothetical protein QUB47_14035 [Microcoleus sp. AT9_B5]